MASTGKTRSPKSNGKRNGLADEVASYVREQIMSAHFRPGEFLRTEPIAEAVGVSITPVREGLLSLGAEGFVTLVPRRGFVVAAFTRQDIRDLFWTQGQLAGELAARAATRITEADMDRLLKLTEETQIAIEQGDTTRIGELGHQFHRTINIAAESSRLARLLAGVVKHLPNQFYASIEAHVDSAPEQHRQLIDALRAQEPERAREITLTHLVDNADYVISMLEQRGLWAEDEAAAS